MSDLDFNLDLSQWERIIPSSEAGQGHIEHPGGFDNRVWQTRSCSPGRFERELLTSLEAVFEAGASELHDVIAGLNAKHCQDRNGVPWSEESFLQEMAVLGH